MKRLINLFAYRWRRMILVFGAGALSALMALAFIPSGVEGAVPKLINFQGILRTGAGQPVADGSYFVTFKIYDAPSGGNILWADTQGVTTSSGLFNTSLGKGIPVPDSVFNDTSRYLGITVFPDPEMTPRQQLVSVGFGYRVSSVDGASGGTIMGNLNVNGDLNVAGKATIGPGHTNTGADAFVAGANNVASGNNSTVGGGANNNARGGYSVVGGGGGPFPSDSNSANGGFSVVGGGIDNDASGTTATIGGGNDNTASGNGATVGGGGSNTASGIGATVGGGGGNTASGVNSIVPGGVSNTALGNLSFAAGSRAKALHSGTFVWGDNTGADFVSTANNQFLIRASGGVGIGTNSPTTATGGQVLHIDNASGASAVRIGDGAANGKQWEIQSTVIGGIGALNFSSTTDLTNPLTILANGNTGIHITTPSHPLHMASGAHVTAGGTWTNASSRNYKTEIQPLKDSEYSEILKKLEKLDVVRFKYKTDISRSHIGLIAEDVPDEITSEDHTGVPTADAIAFLMAALKAQQAKMELQQSKIEELEGMIKDLKRARSEASE